MAGEAKCVIDDKCPVVCKENPCWCEIFDYSTLYENEDNCLIQMVKIAGRYHGQYYSQSLEHTSGQHWGANYWEHRRFRLGIDIDFLNDFTFFNNWNISDSSRNGSGFRDHAGEGLHEGDFFGTIDEMYIKWDPSCGALDDMGFSLTVGKQKQKITREFSTSSKRILTIERSHIVNEVADKKPWGVQVGLKAFGAKHKFGYWLGGFENSYGEGPANPNRDPHWLAFEDGRHGASYNLEYELSDNTSLFFDYVFTNNDNGRQSPQGLNTDESALNAYNHTFAIGTETEWDLGHCDRKAGLITDIIWGVDREDDSNTGLANVAGFNDAIESGEDTFGFVVLPYYDITERLQLVAKYSYASLSRLQRTQRRDNVGNTPRFNLEDVHTFYAGLNYYICDHNLKIMAGYEHLSAAIHEGSAAAVDNGGLTGDSWMIGVRTYW